MLLDTQDHVGGIPLKTVFRLPFGSLYPSTTLEFEHGAHGPFTAGSLASFHQDSTQRIIALNFVGRLLDDGNGCGCLVFHVGALLELHRDCGGTEIGWDEWKHHVYIPSFHPSLSSRLLVSGCRLFHLYQKDTAQHYQMEVYDFSARGRVKYLIKPEIQGLNRINDVSSVEERAKISIKEHFTYVMCGYDSFMFFDVSALVFCALLKLN